MKHHRVQDGTRIAYEVSGPEEGPCIVLCDGIACDGFAWEKIAPALAAEYRILHSHHRGHGRSGLPRDGTRVTVPFLARDIVELMDLIHMKAATFVGHSMGCQVLVEVAYRYPERFRGGVLMCGTPGRALDNFQHTDLGFRALPTIRDWFTKYGKHVAPALRYLVPSRLGYEVAALSEINRERTSRRDLERYLKHLSQMPQEAFLATLQDAAERVANHLLPAIEQPMLVMVGEKDGFTPSFASDPFRTLLPKAEYEIIQGGSHVAPIEFPAEIVERMQAFFTQHGLDRIAAVTRPKPRSMAAVWREAAVARPPVTE